MNWSARPPYWKFSIMPASPEDKVVTAHDVLLEPVSLYQVKRLDHWLMVRAIM